MGKVVIANSRMFLDTLLFHFDMTLGNICTLESLLGLVKNLGWPLGCAEYFRSGKSRVSFKKSKYQQLIDKDIYFATWIFGSVLLVDIVKTNK